MYKNILIAIDDSKFSVKVVDQGVELAKAFKAKICLIHIIDLTLPSPDAGFVWLDMEKYLDSHRKNALALLQRLASQAATSGLKVETQLIENLDHSRISDKILEFVSTQNHDLIVLGTHGRRGFHRFLLGSVADEVIRSASIPVLLIREPNDK